MHWKKKPFLVPSSIEVQECAIVHINLIASQLSLSTSNGENTSISIVGICAIRFAIQIKNKIVKLVKLLPRLLLLPPLTLSSAFSRKFPFVFAFGFVLSLWFQVAEAISPLHTVHASHHRQRIHAYSIRHYIIHRHNVINTLSSVKSKRPT